MKQVLKCLLLWMTSVSICIFISGGFEYLVDHKEITKAIIWLLLNVFMVYACYLTLSYREVYRFSGMHYINKLLNKWNNVL